MNLNDIHSFNYQVTDADLASTLSLTVSDDFPAVLATSRMIALMELAAAHLMQTRLKPGQLSVGVDVNIAHTAPTLAGRTITLKAQYYEKDRARFLFNVTAYDAGGSIGQGQHSRAIIDTATLLHTANNRGERLD